MDRSRREARGEARRETATPAPPARPSGSPPPRSASPIAPTSRLILRRARNRRRPGSLWSRLPRPRAIADACGRALRRALPTAAAVAVLGALGGAAWAGHRWITGSPRFAITQIAIRGDHHVDPDRLRAELPIHVGDSVFTGLADVARAVRGNPWVAAAEVHRVLPHTIAIDLREHAAAAVVDLGDTGERYLVDAQGRPFKRVGPAGDEGDDGRDGHGLPIITGLARAAFTADPAAAIAGVRDALAAASQWRSAQRPAIAEVHVDAHGALTLHTQGPAIAIQLGAPGAEAGARMQAFDAAWAGLGDAERARTRAIHTGTRPDHATVAFAKD